MTSRCDHSSVEAGFDSVESLFFCCFFPGRVEGWGGGGGGGGGGQALWQGGRRNVRDYLTFVFIASPLVKR